VQNISFFLQIRTFVGDSIDLSLTYHFFIVVAIALSNIILTQLLTNFWYFLQKMDVVLLVFGVQVSVGDGWWLGIAFP
jgi:hypothetical protein